MNLITKNEKRPPTATSQARRGGAGVAPAERKIGLRGGREGALRKTRRPAPNSRFSLGQDGVEANNTAGHPMPMRRVAAQVGLIKEATGSARFESGQTIVLASVYGPSQPRYSRHEEYDRATLEVNYNLATLPSVSISGGTGGNGEDGSGGESGVIGSMVSLTTSAELVRAEREGVRILKQSLLSCIDVKACPRTLIVINVCVLRNDGATLSAAINACSLALLNASLPLLFFPMALTYSVLDVSDASAGVMDPTAEQEVKAPSTFVCTVRHDQSPASLVQEGSSDDAMSIILMHATGVFANRHLELASGAVLSAAPELSRFFRGVVKS